MNLVTVNTQTGEVIKRKATAEEQAEIEAVQEVAAARAKISGIMIELQELDVKLSRDSEDNWLEFKSEQALLAHPIKGPVYRRKQELRQKLTNSE